MQYLEKLSEKNAPISSVMLIREWVLPEILSNHSDSVLYWSGKKLARSFPCHSLTEIVDFFERVGFGTLSIVSTKKYEMELHLTGEIVSSRYDFNSEPSFFLEAGFLAQQIQMQKEVVCESIFQTKKRSKMAIFTVQWDQKDIIQQSEKG